MSWIGLLVLLLALGGSGWLCGVLYDEKIGVTSCIGCGKCIAAGECVLKRKPAGKSHEKEQNPS